MGATFGQRLREARLAAGLSQSDLSSRVGIPKPTLSRYENGHVLPALSTLGRLADGLNVTEASLLHGTSDVYEYFIEALRKRGVTFRNKGEADDVADAVARGNRQRRRSRRAV